MYYTYAQTDAVVEDEENQRRPPEQNMQVMQGYKELEKGLEN
jgi:hypothetical protein